jgi:hypothetical protein
MKDTPERRGRRRSGIARMAAAERRGAEAALRAHKKVCLPCSRAVKDWAACPAGMKLASYAELMRKQEELLSPPPEPEMTQDTLF